MEKADLDKLRHYAASTKSPIVFGGVTFIKFDTKTGKATAGKSNVDMIGHPLGADLSYAMAGFQRLEAGKKPLYALTRILDAVDPIERDELGETDKNMWIEGRDPWTATTVLPLFDQETRQVFVFSATYSARGAAANLFDAFADHGIAHPEASDQVPLIEIRAREYIRNDGKSGFAAEFDIVDWIDRPEAILRVTPPPLSILEVVPKAKSAESAATESTPPPESSDQPKASAKPRRKIVPGGKPADFDDNGIPFAPEWRG